MREACDAEEFSGVVRDAAAGAAGDVEQVSGVERTASSVRGGAVGRAGYSSRHRDPSFTRVKVNTTLLSRQPAGRG